MPYDYVLRCEQESVFTSDIFLKIFGKCGVDKCTRCPKLDLHYTHITSSQPGTIRTTFPRDGQYISRVKLVENLDIYLFL